MNKVETLQSLDFTKELYKKLYGNDSPQIIKLYHNNGNEIENVLGVAGRVATANMNALENLPWATADYRELTRQLSWVKALPQVPGGYFTERHIKNAFYTVYNNNEDPRETLQDYVKQINYEISRKRLEFGLPLE